MRTLMALLGISAAVALAGLASADPPPADGDDAGFLAALRHNGISYSDPGRAILAAHAVCTCLDNGEEGLELVHDVKIRNPGFDMDSASTFALISAKFYCPHHLAQA